MSKRKTQPITSTHAPEVVPSAEPVAGPAEVEVEEGAPAVSVPAKWVLVNLKQVVRINGVAYGPGKEILVPASGYEVWKYALA